MSLKDTCCDVDCQGFRRCCLRIGIEKRARHWSLLVSQCRTSPASSCQNSVTDSQLGMIAENEFWAAYERDRDIRSVREDKSHFFEFPTSFEVFSYWQPLRRCQTVSIMGSMGNWVLPSSATANISFNVCRVGRVTGHTCLPNHAPR